MSLIDSAFLKAITTIRTISRGPNALPTPSNERKVQLYGLYKQSTEGDVEGIMPRPVGTDPQTRASQQKWDSWKSREGTPKHKAKLEYVEYLLETMRILSGDAVSLPAWTELRQVLITAKASPDIHTVDTLDTEGASARAHNFGRGGTQNLRYNIASEVRNQYNGQAKESRKNRRRLSVGSLNSSYSHFLRNPILNSPSVRDFTTFSEFGLSEKDRSELQADQIVERLQSVYPPVIPGAVGPSPWSAANALGAPLSLPALSSAASQATGFPQTDPMRSLGSRAADSEHSGYAGSSSFGSLGSYLRVIIMTVKTWTSETTEMLLRLLLWDTLKVLTLLLMLRLIASRPDFLQKSPTLQRVVSTIGKIFVVVFDGFGIDMKLKTPKRVNMITSI